MLKCIEMRLQVDFLLEGILLPMGNKNAVAHGQLQPACPDIKIKK
jgi:hypothetical protein